MRVAVVVLPLVPVTPPLRQLLAHYSGGSCKRDQRNKLMAVDIIAAHSHKQRAPLDLAGITFEGGYFLLFASYHFLRHYGREQI